MIKCKKFYLDLFRFDIVQCSSGLLFSGHSVQYKNTTAHCKTSVEKKA